MSNPRFVKVFLGSSIAELKDERRDIAALERDISNLFSHDEIVVRFIMCENFHPGHLNRHDQEHIDQKLQGCDISLFVFKTKAGEWTRHEYAVARALQQQEREPEHRIFVYFLRVPDEKKEPSLEDFKRQLKNDGLFCNEYETLGDVRFEISMGILTHLGITVGSKAPEAEAAAKNADERFAQYEQKVAQLQQPIHQDIDDLRAQIPDILDDESQLISARIVEVMGLYQKADRWASKTGYDKEKYSDLLFDYAQFLNKYGMYYDAEAVWLRQIPLAEELYGKEHEKTATSYNEIGVAYRNQGNYPKALEYYGKALAIDEKVLGKDHRSTAIDYNNIGLVYWRQGDYPKALEYYGKALAIYEKVLGKDHSFTATTYNNIGTVYRAQGDYPKALEHYGKALAIKEKVLGKDHPSTATTYNNIGAVYDDQGDYPRALEYYGKALAIDEKVLGKDHPGTATDYNNIGSVYYKQKKYREALKYLEKALKIVKARLGDDHPNTKTTQKWIFLTHAAMG